MDIDPDIVGAVIGGWLFNTFGMAGASEFKLYSRSIGMAVVALLRIFYPQFAAEHDRSVHHAA